MANAPIKRALLSVYDKTGIVEFAKALHDEFGIEIISTGGTAKLLKENAIPVTLVEEVTGFPEMMDGRVKTLHPKIHAGILADRDNAEHMRSLEEQSIKPIDMVVVNLYPFEETVADPSCTLEQAIEMIDIGGPCMLRAAAKNHKHVLPVFDPAGYPEVIGALRNQAKESSNLDEVRLRYAAGTFEVTACYDTEVACWLGKRDAISSWPWFDPILAVNWGALRYGENPHQQADLRESITHVPGEPILVHADADSGDDVQVAMSLNNYGDADAALELCKELTRERSSEKLSVCTFIKHTNSCGAGVADDPIEAYRRAYLGDPNAAMGGILACSFAITKDFADVVMHTFDRFGKDAGAGGFFAEVWIAPSFEEDAIELIRTAKPWGERVRLLDVGDMTAAPDENALEYRSITGGVLVQSRDLLGLNERDWKIATKNTPSDAGMNDLRLAWLVCKHTKSNAISVVKDSMLIGNGAGQMSRVMSCRIATWLAEENGHKDKLPGCVAASDAFFPFPDGPKILIDAGATAIIQPGGSKRDQETIDLCNERGVSMILTGTRHFKH